MIEILFLIASLAAFRETARRRGTKAWPFIVVGAVGWWLTGIITYLLFGPGPHVITPWGWVALTYASIFLIGGGGRRMKETWQCPECRGFNSPTTLVCLCGYEPARGQAEPGVTA